MIMCRPGVIFSYETTFSPGQGVIFAFDVLIHTPVTNNPHLVAVQNVGDNYVAITVDYSPTSKKINVYLQNPTWNTVLISSEIELGIFS